LDVLALAPFDPSFALMENNRDVTRKSMLVLVLEKSFYPIIATIVDSIIATIAAGPSARSAEVEVERNETNCEERFQTSGH